MIYHRYNKDEVIEITRDAIHAFTNRDMDKFIRYLDADFSFIADDAPLFLHGIDEFLESIKAENKMPPVNITHEEYTLLVHENHVWVTFGRFHVSSPTFELEADIHFTFVWKQKKD